MNVVPTKQDDGDDRPTKHHRVGESAVHQDAFSRYSSNLLRMKAILLWSEDDEDDEGDDCHRQLAILAYPVPYVLSV